jgi:hypothetical protein
MSFLVDLQVQFYYTIVGKAFDFNEMVGADDLFKSGSQFRGFEFQNTDAVAHLFLGSAQVSDLRQPDHPAASEHEGSHDDARAHLGGILRQVCLRQ